MFKIEKHSFSVNLMREVVSSDNLDRALKHVYKNHIQSYDNKDVRHLSKNWKDIKIKIQKLLLKQQYHLEPLKILKFKDKHLSLWSARDTVVLKAISVVLSNHLNIKGLNNDAHPLAGNGGVPGAIKLKKLSKENL